MTLHFVDPEIDRLAQALAGATGEDIAEAVRNALAERLQRVTAKPTDPEELAKKLHEIAVEYHALPVLDPRTPDEIIGYDEIGMW
jgi:antitoxin VapB